MPPNSQEAAVIRGYLETCLELPWGCYTKDVIDLKKAAKLLDKEHYGLKKIKERVLEALAVRALAPDIKVRPLLCGSSRCRQNLHRTQYRADDGTPLCSYRVGRYQR